MTPHASLQYFVSFVIIRPRIHATHEDVPNAREGIRHVLTIETKARRRDRLDYAIVGVEPLQAVQPLRQAAGASAVFNG
jgi:hypothetical protein